MIKADMEFTYSLGLNDNVDSLTADQINGVDLVWLDRCKVRADDSHLVSVDVDSVTRLSRAMAELADGLRTQYRISYLLIRRNKCFLPFLSSHRSLSPVVSAAFLFLPFRR